MPKMIVIINKDGARMIVEVAQEKQNRVTQQATRCAIIVMSANSTAPWQVSGASLPSSKPYHRQVMPPLLIV